MKRSGEPTENLGQNQHPSAPYQRGQRPRDPRITPRRPRAVRSQLSSADVRAIKTAARFGPERIEPSASTSFDATIAEESRHHPP